MKTILFSNGLNYLSKGFVSWNQLLNRIKGDNLFENGKLPNTMIYERSVIGNPISFDTLTQKEEEIKKDIAFMLANFPSNLFYDKLAALDAENYITTNYDYASLKTYLANPSFELKNKSTEGIYSIRRYKEILKYGELKSRIWHMHGEIDVHQSIMLGLDHYCGSVAKIDGYVKGRYEYQEDKKTIKTASIIDKLKNTSRFDRSSWIELFFNSDVYIIGLGLDFSEIDLWWILNKRARFKLDNRSKNLVNNKIVYFSTYSNEDQPNNNDQLELLATMHVEIVKIKLDESDDKYAKAYDSIFNKIQYT